MCIICMAAMHLNDGDSSRTSVGRCDIRIDKQVVSTIKKHMLLITYCDEAEYDQALN
jgi:hypothetical protein